MVKEERSRKDLESSISSFCSGAPSPRQLLLFFAFSDAKSSTQEFLKSSLHTLVQKEVPWDFPSDSGKPCQFRTAFQGLYFNDSVELRENSMSFGDRHPEARLITSHLALISLSLGSRAFSPG